mmetsp:Transcript_8088/g.19050  ORF Transcript_8088/g.19050 Transcript_8088/m.19050 type:complete len:213 (+) Transcript_8088:636-1274(+)
MPSQWPCTTMPSATASETDVTRDTANPNMTMTRSASDQTSERTLTTMESIMMRSSRKNLSTRTMRMIRANLRMRMMRKMAMLDGLSATATRLMTSSLVEHRTMTTSKIFHCQSSPPKNAQPKPTIRTRNSATKHQPKMLLMTRILCDSSWKGLLALASACTPRKTALSRIIKHMTKSNLLSLTMALICALKLQGPPPRLSVFSELINFLDVL